MFATLLTLAALVGPPWISIEYPGNPLDRSARDAYLLVHTYHHQTPTAGALRGEAVTWENGRRRAIPLRFGTTSRTGVFTLTKQWTDGTPWVLVITYGDDGHGGGATALVSVNAAGSVARVEVPRRPYQDFFVPREAVEADLAEAFRAAGGAGAKAGPRRIPVVTPDLAAILKDRIFADHPQWVPLRVHQCR